MAATRMSNLLNVMPKTRAILAEAMQINRLEAATLEEALTEFLRAHRGDADAERLLMRVRMFLDELKPPKKGR